MGASEGVFQVERDFRTSEDINLVAGARYHPYSLRTVLWKADAAGAPSLFVEVVDGDRVYVIDSEVAFAGTTYQWPNAKSPHPKDLVPPQRIRFRTTGMGAVAVKHSVAVTWAELGV